MDLRKGGWRQVQCRIASEFMSVHLDSQLTEEEEGALQHHLQGCERCSAEWSWMQRADALFAGVTMATPSPLLAEAVMEKVQRRAAWMTMLRGGMILSLLIVVLLGMVFVPLAAFSGPVATVSSSPATVSALVGVVVRIAGILSTLLQAAYLLLRAVVSSPGVAALVAYALGAAALALWWVRVIAGPGSVAIGERTG